MSNPNTAGALPELHGAGSLAPVAIRGHDPMCMGCGPANPDNLGLRATVDRDRVIGRVLLGDRHSGAPGFAHGGAISALFDDVFGHVLIVLNRPGVTANLNVDYRAPAFLGRELDFTAWCERIDGRKLYFHGEARQGDSLVAEARALFIHIDLSHWESSGEPLPDGWKTWGTSHDE